jgi:fluoride ion exporter CrcB/FEX
MTLEAPPANVSPMPDEDLIWQAVLDSNRAWLSGDAERAGALFADDAVMIAPDLAKVGASRAAMVEGFAQYAAQATTHSFAIALVAVPLIVGCFLAGLRAERRKERRQTWRMRSLGLGMIAALSWFSYYAHEYVVVGVVPATLFVAVALAVSLAFVIIPESAYMKKVARQLLPNE